MNKKPDMGTRKFLKLVLKNTQRVADEQQDQKNKTYAEIADFRDNLVKEALRPLGLWATWYQLNTALCLKPPPGYPRRVATGKHFVRLGKAAKRKKLHAPVWRIACAVAEGQDLRKVVFV